MVLNKRVNVSMHMCESTHENTFLNSLKVVDSAPSISLSLSTSSPSKLIIELFKMLKLTSFEVIELFIEVLVRDIFIGQHKIVK